MSPVSRTEPFTATYDVSTENTIETLQRVNTLFHYINHEAYRKKMLVRGGGLPGTKNTRNTKTRCEESVGKWTG